jgi:hypothetical protein
VNNSEVCYISLSNDGYNVSYISRDMARTWIAAGECIELYSVPRDMARTLQAAGEFVEIPLEVSEHIFNSISGFGEGMRRTGGTFRLTDGAYNGNNISIRHYESGWRGGSRAQIRTYNAVQWGSRFSKGGGIAGGLIGFGQVGYEVYQDTQSAGHFSYGYNAQRKSAEVVGGIGGGIGGAKGGAAIGFFIGACFGGVGAPIGAVIGGAIGGVGGGFGGSWGGTKIFDLFVPNEKDKQP